MRGPHPQSRVTLRYRDHVTNKKRYISTFTGPMYSKLSRVVTLEREPNPQIHMIHQPLGHVTNQRRYISTFIRPMNPKLSRVLVILWLLR